MVSQQMREIVVGIDTGGQQQQAKWQILLLPWEAGLALLQAHGDKPQDRSGKYLVQGLKSKSHVFTCNTMLPKILFLLSLQFIQLVKKVLGLIKGSHPKMYSF